MKKISIILIVGGFVILGMQSTMATFENKETKDTLDRGWLYVGGSGGNNFTTIQNAIDAASPGDTIFVYSGVYNENIIVSKSLILIGENRDTTIINGDSNTNTIEISTEDITIQEFTIKNDGSQIGVYTTTDNHIFKENIFTITSYGIYLDYSSGHTITNNLFYNNTKTGIYMKVGENNNITNNEFYNNNEQGIFLTGCGTTHILRNNIRNNREGISTFNAFSNIIKNNVIEYNECGIHFSGMVTLHSNFNIISHNRINNNTGCGLKIENSQFNNIEYNEINGNDIGIHFEVTVANSINNNEISNSDTSEITFTFSLMDSVIKNNIGNVEQSLFLAQINFGFVTATYNWWGSTQWPVNRIRPIAGWILVFPWMTIPYDLDVGPEP